MIDSVGATLPPSGLTALIVLGVALGVVVLGGLVWRGLKHSSLGMILSELSRQIKSGERDAEDNRPRSAGGMDRLLGPRIARDFPTINLDEMKGRARRVLAETLKALSENRHVSAMKDCDIMFIDKLNRDIERNIQNGTHLSYRGVTIHDTVILDYQKRRGLCRITFRLPFGADCIKQTDCGESVSDTETRPTQMRATLTMIYIQDLSKCDSVYQTAFGPTCPHCGAPLESLGTAHCEYCGASLDPIHVRVWKFNDYRLDG